MTDVRTALGQLVAGLNAGELEAIGDLVSHSFYGSEPGRGQPDGTSLFARIYGDLVGALPDLRVRVDGLTEANGTLRGDLHAIGTKTGWLWGSPPSGHPIEWTATLSVRSKSDGKLAIAFEDLALAEVIGLLRDLELVNPPEEMDKPPRHPVEPPDDLLKLIFNGGASAPDCRHLRDVRVFDPLSDVCDTCVESGDIWPALRMCLTCGYVGCCDTSKNRHAHAHFEATGHPLVRSIRMNEGWMWCYLDDAFFPKRTLDSLRSE